MREMEIWRDGERESLCVRAFVMDVVGLGGTGEGRGHIIHERRMRRRRRLLIQKL
jgi:hypothetical protein